MTTDPIAELTSSTEDDLGLGNIQLVPSQLGATFFVEIIIIDPTSGIANLPAINITGGTRGRGYDHYTGFKFTRDLFSADYEKTIQSIINWKGRKRADYTPYYRDFGSNELTNANYADPLRNRFSLVFVHNTITDGQLIAAMKHIAIRREIIPSRMLK